MDQKHLEIARAVIENSLFFRGRSIAGRAAFRRDIDQSRNAIKASRELLERLRQRYRDDMAQAPGEDDLAPTRVSAFDADVLRSAFQNLVRDTGVPECEWRGLAECLAREYVGCEQIEVGLLDWITQK
ncbi:MAG: hypothetical protein E5Y02_10325 [Mesorhizobium sp.]|nr:MAG: hypothetical protein E5Y02_10325 [Mesorhizobium sp.]